MTALYIIYILSKYGRAENLNGQEGRSKKSILRMPGRTAPCFSFFPLCAGRILSRIACFFRAKTWHLLHFSFSDMGFRLSGVGLGGLRRLPLAFHCASVEEGAEETQKTHPPPPLSSVLDHGRPWMKRRPSCHNQVFFCFWCLLVSFFPHKPVSLFFFPVQRYGKRKHTRSNHPNGEQR